MKSGNPEVDSSDSGLENPQTATSPRPKRQQIISRRNAIFRTGILIAGAAFALENFKTAQAQEMITEGENPAAGEPTVAAPVDDDKPEDEAKGPAVFTADAISASGMGDGNILLTDSMTRISPYWEKEKIDRSGKIGFDESKGVYVVERFGGQTGFVNAGLRGNNFSGGNGYLVEVEGRVARGYNEKLANLGIAVQYNEQESMRLSVNIPSRGIGLIRPERGNSEPDLIAKGASQNLPAINGGDSWNKFGIYSNDGHYELFVNDQLLVSANYNRILPGNRIMIGGNGSPEAALEYHFRNFKVSRRTL